MNDLEQFFSQHTGRLIHKWMHYFEIYDRHFARFRGRPVNIVEFGVSQGGSMQMWRNYFGPQAQVFGVDINPNCKQFEEPGVKIFIGDQGDRAFLRSLAETLPTIDILIDDGGHTMQQQIRTFEALFPRVAPSGVYLCEDLHTSYWREFGGGYRRRGTFIEYSKGFIDALHAWHSREPQRFSISDLTRSAHSVHYYDSVVVIEKRTMEPPTHQRVGEAAFADYVPPKTGVLASIKRQVRGRKGS
jgi:cephalosporin hydroxylase